VLNESEGVVTVPDGAADAAEDDGTAIDVDTPEERAKLGAELGAEFAEEFADDEAASPEELLVAARATGRRERQRNLIAAFNKRKTRQTAWN
jgi:hypothetical protein